MRDGQPQAGAAVAAGGRSIPLGEGSEQARLHLFGHADAIIDDLEFHGRMVGVLLLQRGAH